ncbi:MAG TPA: chemotaxis response regulator protein-glutamate methylesterase [Steroidobacteraceae bacterium]|nr:chemotaxis response regulator protein-glutamate methylesterase [Steroidobacteraceae bacterium]
MTMHPASSPNAAPGKRIRVLIVDDSALVRSLLTDILNSDPAIEVVGVASDAHVARERIKALNPDVLTLDVEMPKMDGITFLKNLMRLRPMPVVMVSSLTERGADVTLDALSIGAVDYLSKPKIDLAATLKDYSEELIEKIKSASRASVRALDPLRAANITVRPSLTADAVLPKAAGNKQLRTTDRIIAIGASTGGTEAIKEVLMRLPPDSPGVVITQHIPKAFSTPFAKRMNDCCQITVYEAEDGQQVLSGHAYIAPGDQHLMLVRDGARYVCRLDNGPPVNRHKPSVDVLFRSVAQNAGRNAIGVILTGMGKDGARGLKEMLDTGSRTIAQDEATSVVWGMPGEAVSMGAAQHVLPLESVAAKIRSLADAMDITRETREA